MLRFFVPLCALAFAAQAAAGIAVSGTCAVIGTLTKDPSVTLGDVAYYDYDAGNSYQDDPLHEYAMTTDTSSDNAFDGATFFVSGTAHATLDAPDFSAVRGVGAANADTSPDYDFTLTNTSAVPQTVHLDVALTYSGAGSASPDAAEPDFGAYGSLLLRGGLFDYTANQAVEFGPFRDTFNDGTPFSVHGGYAFGRDYVLAPGESRTLAVYTAAIAYAGYTPAPVPEPAPLAALALALGGLGLLRRRRRA